MLRTSVCLITYNHERTVRDAIDGVLAQRTSFPFEIVVGDDASTDETPRILADYRDRHADRIRLRLATRNEGATANFIGAFNACAGPFVAILEGDDSWTSPHKLQLQVDAMLANPDSTLCGTNAFVDDERHPDRSHVHPGHDRAYLTDAASILAANFFSTCTMVVRKDGPLAIPADLESVWGDWALKLHYALAGETLFLPQQTASYRLTGSGAWSALGSAEKEAEVLRVLRAFEAHVGPSYANVLGPRIRRQLTAVAKAWRAMGDEPRAELALRELAARPVTAAATKPARRPVADFPVPA